MASTVRKVGLPIALFVCFLVVSSCDDSATELDSIAVDPLPAPDTFFPTSTLDRDDGGGADFLNPPRDNFTQTTLLTGKVLIAGGTSSGAALDQALLYDQLAAEFFLTSSLAVARRGHTATLTSAGDVVVVGGIGVGGEPLASVEIYRPSLGTWQILQGMRDARFGHTVTRLSGGDLLVAGGVTSSFGTVTDTCEILDVSTLLLSDATPIQAGPGSMFGSPRAFHTATSVPIQASPPLGGAGPCAPGNFEYVVIFVGGLTGSPGGPAAALAATVAVFYPGETTPGPGGVDVPGRWETMIVGGAAIRRWGHQAMMVECAPQASPPFASVLLVGGIGAFTPALGALTSGSPGQSVLEDSEFPAFSYAKLEVATETLSAPGAPTGTIVGGGSIGDPTIDPIFVGGGGSRAIFHEGSKLVLFLGGNTYDRLSNLRAPHSSNAYLIDPELLAHAPSISSMSVGRSFCGLSLLPGPDEAIGTADDTVLVVGGEFASTGESATAEEYAFP
ncbi:MAG: kelch repeat-containing protein [Planctomycetota bacterium]|nr:kelch repeat-containing protein [Planctomycetota bacterium]